MKNTSLIIFGLFLLMSYTSMAQQNASSNIDRSNMDLPPGTVLNTTHAKNHESFTFVDYSYKLEASTQNANITSYTLNDFLLLFGKNSNSTSTYYTNVVNYFNSLSIQVKNKFTAKELAYIYMYDKKLRTKLLAIQ